MPTATNTPTNRGPSNPPYTPRQLEAVGRPRAAQQRAHRCPRLGCALAFGCARRALSQHHSPSSHHHPDQHSPP